MEPFTRVCRQPLLTVSDCNWDLGHGSIMFPSVIDMSGKVASPLARYYMYLAAHGGKGIMLALADRPEGPWRLYDRNPVHALEMAPELWAHISSPDVVWVPETGRLHLYYHGPNAAPDVGGQHTGMATSTDGLRFTPSPDNPIITNGPPESWRASMAAYIRVFRIGERFHGMFMGHRSEMVGKAPVSCELWAHSDDGLTWQFEPETVVLAADPDQGDHVRIRHVGVWSDGRSAWVFYSTYDSPDMQREIIRLARIPFDGDRPGPTERLGTCLVPTQPWERDELRDPYPLVVDGRLWLYYAGGGEEGIGVAHTDWAP